MTHAPSTYKIPTCGDRPEQFKIRLFETGRNREETIFHSKAVGEPPLTLAVSVFCAIVDAVASVCDHEALPASTRRHARTRSERHRRIARTLRARDRSSHGRRIKSDTEDAGPREPAMTVQMAHMTQDEVKAAIDEKRLVILPTGATESHGPHMPTDTDTHQAEHIAIRLAERIGAVVAPPIAYAISKTFEKFPGTISLSIPTYQQLVYEVGTALVKMGFPQLVLLNGNRPNGTSNDAVARRLIDDLDGDFDFKVTAVSYWSRERRRSTAYATRTSVEWDMAASSKRRFSSQPDPSSSSSTGSRASKPPLVGWDLVAPGDPVRTYGPAARARFGPSVDLRRPTPGERAGRQGLHRGHRRCAARDDGNLQPSYEERR